MHFVKPDTAFIAGLGLLHGDVKPVLLFDGIAAAFVVAGLVRLVVLFAVGVVKSFAKQNTARRAARDGEGIVVGQLAAEGRAARAQAHISGSSGHGGAAREQTHGTGKRNELKQNFFINVLILVYLGEWAWAMMPSTMLGLLRSSRARL